MKNIIFILGLENTPINLHPENTGINSSTRKIPELILAQEKYRIYFRAGKIPELKIPELKIPELKIPDLFRQSRYRGVPGLSYGTISCWHTCGHVCTLRLRTN